MKNANKVNAQTVSTSAKTNSAKKEAALVVEKQKELTKINLAQFADALKEKNVEKTQKDKQHLYLYPETFSPADLNGEKGKKFRQGLRNKLGRFSNNIFFYCKTENAEKLKEEIENFKTFYKENYHLNDFSVKSISASEKNVKDIELMLSIIKEVGV